MHDAENVALSGLYVYPIKACAGISLQRAELSVTGLRHDRRWMLVDEAGRFMSLGGEVYFGRNLIHDALGTVRVGDSAEVTPR